MLSTKYIGMDVHKESISIAMMNSAGKLVMECVLETKASAILQFVDGLRGELQITFEEGTWAAWLYDLLKPRVAHLVVCDPRRNALLKEGNKSDRIDARKLTELLYLGKLQSVYPRRARRTHPEGVGTQLSDHQQRCGPGHDACESVVPQLGHSLRRQAGLCRVPSCGVAGQDQRTRRAPASRVLLPTTRCIEIVASRSSARVVGGEQETQGLAIALRDSLHGSDPGSSVDGHFADTAPLPHQTAAVDLQRPGHRDA